MLDIKSSHIMSLNHTLHSGSSAGGPGDYCTHPPVAVDTTLPGTHATPPPSTATKPQKRDFLTPPSTSTPSPLSSPSNPKHPSRNRNHTRRTSRNAHPILFAQLQM
ncbi:hypothetical protein AAF712_000679, partial [Marasmius tenuissimus]